MSKPKQSTKINQKNLTQQRNSHTYTQPLSDEEAHMVLYWITRWTCIIAHTIATIACNVCELSLRPIRCIQTHVVYSGFRFMCVVCLNSESAIEAGERRKKHTTLCEWKREFNFPFKSFFSFITDVRWIRRKIVFCANGTLHLRHTAYLN